jgi:hypothetical protein
MENLGMIIPSAQFEHQPMSVESACRGDINIRIDEFIIPLKFLHIWPEELSSGYIELYGLFELYDDLNDEEQLALGRLHGIDGRARYFRLSCQPPDKEAIEIALKCKVSGALNGYEYNFIAAADDL